MWVLGYLIVGFLLSFVFVKTLAVLDYHEDHAPSFVTSREDKAGYVCILCLACLLWPLGLLATGIIRLCFSKNVPNLWIKSYQKTYDKFDKSNQEVKI